MNITEALDKVIGGGKWSRQGVGNSTTEYRKEVEGIKIIVSITRRELFEVHIVGKTLAVHTTSEWDSGSHVPGVIETRAASTLSSALAEVEAEMGILKGDKQ